MPALPLCIALPDIYHMETKVLVSILILICSYICSVILKYSFCLCLLPSNLYFSAWIVHVKRKEELNGKRRDIQTKTKHRTGSYIPWLGEVNMTSTLHFHFLYLCFGWWYFDYRFLSFFSKLLGLRKSNVLKCFYSSQSSRHTDTIMLLLPFLSWAASQIHATCSFHSSSSVANRCCKDQMHSCTLEKMYTLVLLIQPLQPDDSLICCKIQRLKNSFDFHFFKAKLTALNCPGFVYLPSLL